MHLDHVTATLPGGWTYPFPRMMTVEQRFPRPVVEDVGSATRAALAVLDGRDLAGRRIAVTAGSRGIARIADVLAAIVAGLKARGAEPFLVPAMGSHGGGTAEGQIGVLRNLGITEESAGAPIRASMEVIETARLDDGLPLYTDRLAAEADGIVLCNRIKPHPSYKGDYESGLMKMLCIGLGKHRGASSIHQFAFDRFSGLLPRAGAALLAKLPVLCGIAVVENAYDEPAIIEGVLPERLLEREPRLLAEAKRLVGRFLVPAIDVLVIDRIGKDVSGSGMDSVVTGRPGTRLPGFDAPPIQRIVVRDLTAATHGNATGIGMADIVTLHCADKIDFGITYTNGITSMNLEVLKLPVVANSDREALVLALRTCRGVTPETVRVVRVRDTLSLHRFAVSESYGAALQERPDITVAGPPEAMRFDAAGALLD